MLVRRYVHAQQPISYLPKDEIYCVTAEYTQTSATAVDVHNYANHDRVNGKVSDSGGTLQAVIKDAASPAKLAVGPKFLPHLLYGPYWVVAYAPTAHPPWAVIAGGQPTQGSPARSLCAAGEYSLFGACRKKVAGPAGPPPEQLCADGEGINHSGPGPHAPPPPCLSPPHVSPAYCHAILALGNPPRVRVSNNTCPHLSSPHVHPRRAVGLRGLAGDGAGAARADRLGLRGRQRHRPVGAAPRQPDRLHVLPEVMKSGKESVLLRSEKLCSVSECARSSAFPRPSFAPLRSGLAPIASRRSAASLCVCDSVCRMRVWRQCAAARRVG